MYSFSDVFLSMLHIPPFTKTNDMSAWNLLWKYEAAVMNLINIKQELFRNNVTHGWPTNIVANFWIFVQMCGSNCTNTSKNLQAMRLPWEKYYNYLKAVKDMVVARGTQGAMPPPNV